MKSIPLNVASCAALDFSVAPWSLERWLWWQQPFGLCVGTMQKLLMETLACFGWIRLEGSIVRKNTFLEKWLHFSAFFWLGMIYNYIYTLAIFQICSKFLPRLGLVFCLRNIQADRCGKVPWDPLTVATPLSSMICKHTSIFQTVLFEPHPLASIQHPLEDPGMDLFFRKNTIKHTLIPSAWNTKCPIFLCNFTPKASNYCLKNRALGFPGVCLLQHLALEQKTKPGWLCGIFMDFSGNFSWVCKGFINLPILGKSNNTNIWSIFRDFPYNNAFFGLAIPAMPPPSVRK